MKTFFHLRRKLQIITIYYNQVKLLSLAEILLSKFNVSAL